MHDKENNDEVVGLMTAARGPMGVASELEVVGLMTAARGPMGVASE